MKSRILLAAVLGVSLAPPCYSWGPLGHRTIAKLALERLSQANAGAAAKVREILGGESVEEAAIWPDDVRPNKIAARSGRFADTPEGQAFNAAHPDNPMWHFVDLPLGVSSYAADKRFTPENNIVVILGKCIDVLEGKSDFMSRREALRYLLHLTGDLHQPLHVAVGYYKFDGGGEATLVTDPNQAAEIIKESDLGGNKLLLSKEMPLHKYWDENLVEMVGENEGKLVAALGPRIAGLKPANSGPVREWPARWAQESAAASREMYQGIHFGKRFPPRGNYWTIYITLKPEAKEQWPKLAAARLAAATKNLADLLGAIQWK